MKNTMPINSFRLFLAAAIITMGLTGLLAPQASMARGSKKAKAGTTAPRRTGPYRVAFDMAHNEIFSPENTGRLHYSSFYEGFRKAGAETSVNMRTVTPAVLKDLDAYVIAGPASPLITPEILALKGFIGNGGSLLVLLHISGPVARLTEAFGIVVSNFVVSEVNNTIDGRSQDFYVTRISDSPVTKGIEKIAVYGTWALLPDNEQSSLARTSEKAWADLNRNRTKDKGEPTQAFTIVAVKEFERGRVVVVADDAPFANAFINVGDNARLASNIIEWFKANPVVPQEGRK